MLVNGIRPKGLQSTCSRHRQERCSKGTSDQLGTRFTTETSFSVGWLREGDVPQAKSRLLEAGKTKGSAPLSSFGPNMALAKELLEKGEKEVVLEYFRLCKKFWTGARHNQTLDQWADEVTKGRIPDFRANLVY